MPRAAFPVASAQHVILSLVVAVARNGVIGQGGTLPWCLPGDLRQFRRITMGKPMIMGRKTWDSLPRKPLPGRPHIVLTRCSSWRATGAQVATDFDHAVCLAMRDAVAGHEMEICVIGGAEIFRLALSRADRIYLTRIDAEFAGDVLFSVPDGADWQECDREEVPPDGAAPGHVFSRLERIGPDNG